MDWSMAHLHIAINHLPIFAAVFAVGLLLWGLVGHKRDIVTVGLAIAVLAGVGSFAARETGQDAEHQVEDNSWANRRLIHEHEELADTAFLLSAAAGVLALVALVMRRGGRPGSATLSWVTFVALLVSMAFLANTALYGGYIRHDEVRPAGLDTTQPARRERPLETSGLPQLINVGLLEGEPTSP